ncbi:MAG: hypothetical protein FMNOHCHN_02664 [Ignavibacteriaceae bacterium]|nr:hypothetical protein [Ignavibacteriaceae bacterium]
MLKMISKLTNIKQFYYFAGKNFSYTKKGVVSAFIFILSFITGTPLCE